MEGSQPSSSRSCPSAVFVVLVLLTVAVLAFAPALPLQPEVRGLTASPGTVTVKGFAQMRGNWIAAYVIFTNSTGFSYYASIGEGDPNYDPVVGGVYSIQLPNNGTYAVQVRGILTGQLNTCNAGTLTLQGTETMARHNWIC